MPDCSNHKEIYVLIKTGFYFILFLMDFCCKVEHAEIIPTEDQNNAGEVSKELLSAPNPNSPVCSECFEGHGKRKQR